MEEDAHELKTEYVKGLKDRKIDHYNLYKNSKIGESFMIHNKTGLVVPIVD